jgi:hypothetical protein
MPTFLGGWSIWKWSSLREPLRAVAAFAVLRIRASGLGFRDSFKGLGVRVQGSGFRLWGFAFGVLGCVLRVEG